MPAIRAPSGRNASVPSADGCESLQAELELARATVTELEKLLYGVPKPWTPDVPPEYQPDAVMERVRRVFSECDVPGDLVGFDCDEEPCFSIIDATGNATAVGDAVVGCPAWKDAWGTGVGSANRPVECRDGTRRTLLMLSPGSGPVTEEERAELLARGLSAEQMADLENSQKRLTARLASAEEQLCSRK